MLHLRRRRASRPNEERGSVTAETAIALPALVLTASLLIAGIAWAAAIVRCHDAAGTLARAIARGEDAATVQTLATASMPPGASYRLEQRDGSVLVTVRASSDRGPLSGLLPDIESVVRVPVEP
jgi:hypothetical protein